MKDCKTGKVHCWHVQPPSYTYPAKPTSSVCCHCGASLSVEMREPVHGPFMPSRPGTPHWYGEPIPFRVSEPNVGGGMFITYNQPCRDADAVSYKVITYLDNGTKVR